MTPGKKYTLSTSVFYLILFPLMAILDSYSPSGPCGAGLGMFLFILTLFMAPMAFVVSFAGWLRGNRSYKGPAFINGAIVVALVILMYTGRI